MGELHTPIPLLRERLTGLLADWGAELSMVLKELEEKRARLEQYQSGANQRDDDLEALRKQIEGQEHLIETLKGEAEEVSKLRQEQHANSVDIERLTSELDAKKELIRALRRDAESVDRLKAEAKLKDREIERIKSAALKAEQHAQQLEQELVALRDSATDRASEESAELEAVRAELAARKTLIKSLRADQERVAALEASLEEKREVIVQLEASINRHANTITELKRSADTWKRKYQMLKGADASATSAHLPTLTATDVAVETLERAPDAKIASAAQQAGDVQPDATIAIDMRRSLLEARRSAGQGQIEK